MARMISKTAPASLWRPPRKLWHYLVPVLLLTFWLGARGLNDRPIWGDEQYSIYFAGGAPYEPMTPAQVWERVAVEDPVLSPGYTILLNLWMRVAGTEPAALRLLSTFAAVLTLAFTWRLACQVLSRRVALFATAVLCTSVMFIYYAHEMRVYMLLTLVSMVTIWLYLRVVYARRFQGEAVGALALSATSLFYLHYFGVFPFLALGLYHLLFAPKNRRWWAILAALLLAPVAFLPWVSVLVAGLAKFGAEVDVQQRALANGPLLQELGWLFSNGAPLLLVIALAGIPLVRKRGPRAVWFLSLVMLVTMLAMNALLHNIPMSRTRYFLLLWPLFALLMGLGLDRLSRWHAHSFRWAGVLAAAFFGLGVANSHSPALIAEFGGARHIYPFQHILSALRLVAQEDDLLVNYWPDARVDLNNRVVEYYFSQLPTTSVIVVSDPNPDRWEQQSDVLPELLRSHERLWVAYMPQYAPGQREAFTEMQARLAASYHLCSVAEQSDRLSLTLYTQHSACCAATESDRTRLTFGDGMIRLSGVERVDPGEAGQLRFIVGWSIRPDAPLHTYSASLQLLNASGEKVAQADYGLRPQSYVCETTSLDVSELPPGTYTLQAAVYAWQTGERLIGATVDGQTGDLLPVETLTLE